MSNKPSASRNRHPRLLYILLVAIFALLVILAVSCGPTLTSTPTLQPSTLTSTSSLSPTLAPTQTPYIITATAADYTPIPTPQGFFFLSLAEGAHYHLFACAEQTLAFTRLTSGARDDITPALSPDGRRLAFSSNLNGYWNLYTLDLLSGVTLQLTDSPDYKAAPSWSSDGAFLAYEGMVDGNLEILITSSTDSSYTPINLTRDLSMDASPAWDPVGGREIAFISNRTGEPEVWLVNLDTYAFTDLSNTPRAVESHPAWSPSGSSLAWASVDAQTGLSGIYLLDLSSEVSAARWLASGNSPVWQDAAHLAALLSAPNQSFLTAFSTGGMLNLAPVLLPGPVNGLAYSNTALSLPGPFQQAAQDSPALLYVTVPNPQPGSLPGRASLVVLEGVQAPYPKLHELADDSFQALRNQVALLTGWDALASLQNAFVPLTTSLDPGLGEDWLYTGRAFALNPSLVDAGWVMVVREDFGQQTYWRTYLRVTAQDGSQGAPLSVVPWDFSARSGDPAAYENGGRLMKVVPPGYWLDFTSLALQFGWERLPALTNWRTYYAGVRFNEFAFTEGLDWRTAMLQLYPQDVLVTPTVVVPPTRTPTNTPLWYRSPTPTRTPTLRPTNTP